MMLHPGLEPGCPTIARVALAGHLEPGLRSSDGVGTINEDHHPWRPCTGILSASQEQPRAGNERVAQTTGRLFQTKLRCAWLGASWLSSFPPSPPHAHLSLVRGGHQCC